MNDRKKMMAVAVEMVITAPSLSHSLSPLREIDRHRFPAIAAALPHPKLSQNFQCGSTSIELSSLDGYEYELLLGSRTILLALGGTNHAL